MGRSSVPAERRSWRVLLDGWATGCGGGQSTLDAQSKASSTISSLWWVMLVGSAIIFSVVVALLLFGVLRRRGMAPEERPRRSPGTTFVVIAGVVVPAVVLVALFVLTVDALPKTSPSRGSTQFEVDVVARQWFWDVTYPGTGARTANEIHIPVGVPVDVRVRSADVIHSLWVPELNRKIDVIPGQVNDVVFDARRAGVFRGQCAEFCGVQHANMALYVVAEPRSRFRALADAGGGAGSAAGDRRTGARPAGLARFGLRVLPPDRGHERNRQSRPGSDAHRKPAVARCRDDPEQSWLPGRLDSRPAAHQTGQQDARPRIYRRRAAVTARLPGEPALMAIANVERLQRAWAEPGPFVTAVATVDHKRIGVRYLVTATVFFLLAGLEALTLRTQLAQPGEHVLSPEAYDQLFSMHGITMIFLFVTPMLSGFGNYFVPLQLGARDMAFPRLNALGYWIFLASGLFIYSSILIGKAPDDGWFNYAPLSLGSHGPNIDFYGLGPDLPRSLVDRGRHQLHRHDDPPARAGNVDQPDAALLLGCVRHLALDHLRRSVAQCRLSPARALSQVGLPLLRHCARRRSAALAAPVLDLRPPRRVHHLPTGGGDRLDNHPSLLATADGGIPSRCARDDGDWVAWLRRLGSPHVRRWSAAGDDDVFRGREHGDRDPERDSDLRLAGDDHRRAGRSCGRRFCSCSASSSSS